MPTQWAQELVEHFRISPRFQEPMKLHTSLRVGGAADIFLQPDSLAELKKAILFAKKYNLPVTVLGGGTNILVSDKGLRGVVIKLGPFFNKITQEADGKLRVKAAAKTSSLVKRAQELGLSGLEFAWGIPGTVGGAVYMNAGAAGGAFSNLLTCVQVVNNEGELEEYAKEKLSFDYRQSVFQGRQLVITECLLQLEPCSPEKIKEKMMALQKKRLCSQPSLPSAGSVFKNPPGNFAGLLIQKAGLKGFAIGDAQVSEVHANFIVNRGNATASDIYQLIQLVSERVKSQFNISLELEIKILGDW